MCVCVCVGEEHFDTCGFKLLVGMMVAFKLHLIGTENESHGHTM